MQSRCLAAFANTYEHTHHQMTCFRAPHGSIQREMLCLYLCSAWTVSQQREQDKTFLCPLLIGSTTSRYMREARVVAQGEWMVATLFDARVVEGQSSFTPASRLISIIQVFLHVQVVIHSKFKCVCLLTRVRGNISSRVAQSVNILPLSNGATVFMTQKVAREQDEQQ